MAARVARLSLLAALVLLVARCGGTGPAAPIEEPPLPEAPAGPAYRALFTDADGLKHVDLATDAATVLAPGAAFAGLSVPAPDGRRVAVAVRADDETRLLLVDVQAGAAEAVDARPGRVVYTAAWDADGRRLAFGHYAPRADGTPGRGGVRVREADGTVRSAGCSASVVVHAWQGSDALVVGDGANLYAVGADGCATRVRLDLTKRHHVAVAPDGRHAAYIFRDLVFDRQRRAYEPDSALYVAPLDGGEERLVAGDRYRARHLAWSPDGTQLAFDVAVPDAEARAVSLFDLSTAQSSYLFPPAAGSDAADVQPRWSPEGGHVAFVRRGGGAATPLVYTFGSPYTRSPAPDTLGLDAARLHGWAGDDALVLAAPGGAAAVVPVQGGDVVVLPPHEALVHVAPR